MGFFLYKPASREEYTINGASVIHPHKLPPPNLFCCVPAVHSRYPFTGALKEPSVSDLTELPKKRITRFSSLVSFWQGSHAPAVLATLMQMRVCLIKGLIRLLFESDMAY